MQEKTGDNDIKRMADLLRQGTTLTELSCPACVSPLFRLKDGTLRCAKCEKKVIVVREGEEAGRAMGGAIVKLEATLLAKVEEVQGRIQRTEDAGELQKLSTALSELLNSLEKIKKMKKS